MVTNSNKNSRILQLLTVLQSGQLFSVDELTKILGLSRRTLFRDLDELKKTGVSYRYDRKKGGYIIDQEFFLPPINLSHREALGLCLLVHRLGGQIPVPFRNAVLFAGLKIESRLPSPIKKYCNLSLKNVSVKPSPQTVMHNFDEIYAALQQACLKKRKVRLRYNSLYEKKEILTELCPYHLCCGPRAWYVLGLSSLHKSVRTFKLNRIQELKVLKKGFVNDKGFDVNEYFGKAWAFIPEGKLYNIRLRFLPKVAHNVAEVCWQDTQQLFWNKDGSLTVEFCVDGLGEIFWWILGYGDQVEVLAPAVLRKRIIKAAENILKLNRR